MADLLVVAVGDCFDDVAEDAFSFLFVDALALLHASLEHFLAGAVLHHQVKLFGRLVDLVQAYHVRMVDIFEDADFVDEPHRVLDFLFANYFDGPYSCGAFLRGLHHRAELTFAHRTLLIEVVIVFDATIPLLNEPLPFDKRCAGTVHCDYNIF